MQSEERQPTEYEQSLMGYLKFRSLKELEEFLNLPSQGCPGMQVPEPNEGEQVEDAWQESQEA